MVFRAVIISLSVFAVFFIIFCVSGEYTNIKYKTPFTWKKRDNFDVIMDKFSKVTAENCQTKSISELTLSKDAVSQVPQYNQLHMPIFFQNRSTLVHALNMAFNRALYFSYIFQAQNASEIDFQNNPGLLYYYMSTTADITANPNILNGSHVIFGNHSHYPNWMTTVKFNITLPLFGASAWRADDYNEPTNRLREPSNNTIDIVDLGSGRDSNYTHPNYKPKHWYNLWLPDDERSKDTIKKFTYQIGIRASNQTGHLLPMVTTPYFGPPQPKETEVESLPVRFTDPYFDCGRSNRWIISATSPIIDYMVRYTNWTHLRRPKVVAVAVIDTEFEKLDINQCDLGVGHVGPNAFAGTHRCKKTTMCEPLFGFGFQRGGYQCHCKPGYRLPSWQDGPFLGIEIEESTEEEYQASFDCVKIYEGRRIPQEDPVIIGKQSVKKTAVITSEFDRYKRSTKYGFMDYVMAPLSLFNRDRKAKRTSKLVSRNKRSSKNKVREKVKLRAKRSFDYRKLERTQNNFDYQAYSRMKRLMVRKMTITKQTCSNKAPQLLLLPGDVSHGVEKMLEHQGRTALRLAHFISNYLQNVVDNEIIGIIQGNRLLHESQLWGEVMANVMADRKIVASGIFFDRYKYKMSTPLNNSNPLFKEGISREFFGPYAYRVSYEEGEEKQTTLDKYQIMDMAGNKKNRYVSERWFMDMKSRWATNFYHAKRFVMRPMVRMDSNGTSRIRLEYYPMTYRAPTYEDGVWLRPTFKCDKLIDDWVLTYVVPFFGLNELRTRLEFKGVVTVESLLDEIDINQCPDDFKVANAFKGTARCDFETTYCVPMLGLRFKEGSYKCECKQGYEMPFDLYASYDGATMEKEYLKLVRGKPNRFDTLKCRIAAGVSVQFNAFLVISLTFFYFLLTDTRS